MLNIMSIYDNVFISIFKFRNAFQEKGSDKWALALVSSIQGIHFATILLVLSYCGILDKKFINSKVLVLYYIVIFLVNAFFCYSPKKMASLIGKEKELPQNEQDKILLYGILSIIITISVFIVVFALFVHKPK
jgi:hypothetical protein